jgi:aryl-alcohol dehydrogenase-like predicted oxidoreductase
MSLPFDLKESKAIIKKALHHGINYFDTADLYNKGKNEELVGELLKNYRQDIVLATKVGNQWSSDSDEVQWNASKAYIRDQVHNSLLRLQTDYIDLYQLHGGMASDNTEETIDAFESLKQEGLIRAYGISSIRPNVIRRFLDQSDVSSIMMQYSLLDRRPEEYLDEIGRAGCSVVTRGTLAKGLLTNSGLERAETTEGYLAYGAAELKETLRGLMGINSNLHALAIHSVLENPAVASILAGASSAAQLAATIEAYETAVPAEQIQQAKTVTKQTLYEQHRD